LLFGAAKRDIAMPTSLVVDKDGRILTAHRASRVDDRPHRRDWLQRLWNGVARECRRVAQHAGAKCRSDSLLEERTGAVARPQPAKAACLTMCSHERLGTRAAPA